MRNKATVAFLIVCLATLTAGCTDVSDEEVYTLYRDVPSNSAFRTHEATFDTESGAGMNKMRCERVQKWTQSYFDAVPAGGKVTVWCEKGRFRK